MTKIIDFLNHAAGTYPGKIDWSDRPWVIAQPALAWIGVAPEVVGDDHVGGGLSAAEEKAICDRIVLRFVDESGQFAWSSDMLRTAANAVALVVGAAPEALLRSLWDFVADKDLDKNVYNFCFAIAVEVRGSHRNRPGWDLSWALSFATPSQACLRYWMLSIKAELWTDELETSTMDILRPYPFEF